jgi:zinc/manganese transport system substrate-binding protein
MSTLTRTFGVAAALLTFTPAAYANVNVVTTTQDLAALTQAVGGSNVTVAYIARGDMDPHFVDAKPSYMLKLSSAQLVVAVGMELEVGWLPSLLTGSRNPKVATGTPGYLDASTAITPIEVPSGTIDRSRGDLHPQGNPHYWLNPENGRKVAHAIEARLEQLDPANASAYKANLATFDSQLTAKEAQWTSQMAGLKGTNIIGYHSTFDYFAAAYGLNVVGFVEPKPGIPPTPQHTLELAALAKSSSVKLVLVESYHNPADAGPIASASGAKVVTVPSSVGGAANVNTYFDLFDTLVHTLTN